MRTTTIRRGWAALVVVALCWFAAIPAIASTSEGDALLGRYWNPDRTRQVEGHPRRRALCRPRRVAGRSGSRDDAARPGDLSRLSLRR